MCSVFGRKFPFFTFFSRAPLWTRALPPLSCLEKVQSSWTVWATDMHHFMCRCRGHFGATMRGFCSRASRCYSPAKWKAGEGARVIKGGLRIFMVCAHRVPFWKSLPWAVHGRIQAVWRASHQCFLLFTCGCSPSGLSCVDSCNDP